MRYTVSVPELKEVTAMAAFKGVKPGDLMYIETRTERGYALAERVAPNGVDYVPIGGEWNRSRINREPATARQIKTVFRKLGR